MVGTSNIDDDTFHTTLSNARRRSAIKYLDEYGSLDKGELAALVAADEVGKDPDELDSDERKRVLISLTQQHLDYLEEHDITERERDIIHQGPNFEEMIAGMQPRGGSKTLNLTLENATINIQAELPDEFD